MTTQPTGVPVAPVQPGPAAAVTSQPTRVLKGFVAGQSMEVVSARTATAKVFANPDGSLSSRISSVPVHYQDATGNWQDIDTSVAADPAHPGQFQSKANSWAARFAPLPQGVSVTTAKGVITMAPAGAAAVAPVLDPAHPDTVTYPNAWPGVDLRYQVLSYEVKEDIIVRQQPGRSSFSFATGPTSFAADAKTPGALAATGTMAGAAQIAAPEVLDRNGIPVGTARPVLASTAGTVSVAVDPAWLAGLTAADFPVDIDPSWVQMGGYSYCYKSDGTTVNPCQIRTGNTREPAGNRYWRTSTSFDYSGLLGAHVWQAQVDISTLAAGTANSSWISLFQTSASSFYGQGAAEANAVAGTTSFSYYSDRIPGSGADTRLASLYDYYAFNRAPGIQLFFVGNEAPGVYTYKQLTTFTLTLTYNYPPTMATPTAPANGSSGHSLTPTLAVNPVTESDGDSIYYYYRLCTGADAETACVFNSNWLQNASSLAIPAGILAYNTTYYWHVYTYDGLDVTNPNWVWSYHTYNAPPTMATPTAPANGSSGHSLTPTLAVNPVTESDGDPVNVYYRLCTGADAESGYCVNSGWLPFTTSWTIPAGSLAYNTTYYWHVYINDSIDQTNPSWVWSYHTTNSPPPVPNPQAGNPSGTQANPAVVTNTTPTLSVPAVVDPDGDSAQYQFQIASTPDGLTAPVASSPWLSAVGGTATFTPTGGNLVDGATYYWVARAKDSTGDVSGLSAWPAVAQASAFRVDLRLGIRPTHPSDSLAGAAVNLASGNLVYTTSGPSFSTVGGPVGTTFTYNSMAAVPHGLSTNYTQDTNANGAVDTAEPVMYHDIEPGPAVSGYVADVVTGHYVAVWTGMINLPAGPWTITAATVGTCPTECATLSVAGQTSGPSNNATLSGTAVGSPPPAVAFKLVFAHNAAGINLPAGLSVYDNGGIIPGSWFQPTDAVLPDGWSESSDGLFTDSYNLLRPLNSTTVQLIDGSGAAHLYTWKAAAWAPPAGEDGTLAHAPDGTWSLWAGDGYHYNFDNQGHLTNVVSSTDDTHAAAPTRLYTSPNGADWSPRLTSLTTAPTGPGDVGKTITYTYGGATPATCPTVAGTYDADAPKNMLCRIAYSGFGGGETDLYYSNSHLARIVNPGDTTIGYPTTDFAYGTPVILDGVSTSLLTAIRSPLVNDAIRTGTIPEPPTAVGEAANAHMTVVAYQTPAHSSYAVGQVASITAPTASDNPTDFNARMTHSYTDTPTGPNPTQVNVTVAGLTGLAGLGGYARQLTLDPGGHPTKDIGADGIQVINTWDNGNDRVLTAIDYHVTGGNAGAGLETTSVYDPAGRLTDTYGPAAPSCFTATPDGYGHSFYKDNATCTTPDPAHHTTGYDETINGLGATWYSAATQPAGSGPTQPTGAPALHTTTTGWETFPTGTPGPAVSTINGGQTLGFAGRLTGEITVPGTVGQPSNYHLSADANATRISIDDTKLADTWAGPTISQITQDSPAGYWRLSDPTGATTATDQTNNSPGTYTSGVTLGAATNVTTDLSTAAQLNGTNGQITIAPTPSTALDLTGDLSIDAWVKPTANGAYRMILTKDQGAVTNATFELRLDPSGVLQFLQYTTSGWQTATATASVSVGAWSQVAVTKQGASVTLYINGTASGTATFTGSVATTTAPALIGVRSDGYPFNGSIHDVAIYPSALSAARVLAHYNAATTAPPADTGAAVITAGVHRVQVDYQSLAGPARLKVSWGTIGGALAQIDATKLKPRYNLTTTTQITDTTAGSPGTKTITAYTAPELGLATSATSDPGGQNLVTSTTYEPAGTGFYRQKTTTLPAGNATTYSYYGTDTAYTQITNPCQTGTVNQGGRLWQRSGPSPTGTGGQLVSEYAYDAAGRTVGEHIVGDPWTCTTYDTRGDPTQTDHPALFGQPARSVINNYAVGGNSLITSVQDNATGAASPNSGTITTIVDLLGRVVSYTDIWNNTTATTYWQAGQIKDQTSPVGAQHTDYDNAGRIKDQQLGGQNLATTTWDATTGLMTGAAYPNGTGNAGNGTSLTVGRDSLMRQNQLTWTLATSTTLTSDQITRSQSGRVTAETIDGNTASPSSFGYDSVARLSTAVVPGHTLSYGFAGTGGCGALATAGANTDRTTAIDNGTTTAYCYNKADQLTSTTDPRFSAGGPPPAPTVDQTVSGDQPTPAATISAPPLTTTAANELVLAFVQADDPGYTQTVTAVTGGGLTWTLAARANNQPGTAEIWQAHTTTTLSAATITANLAGTVAASITVTSFIGAANTVGVTATGSGVSAPAVTLTTGTANSLVWGTGYDTYTATPHTPNTGQTMAHEFSPNNPGVVVGDFWTQKLTANAGPAGTPVNIGDTAPTGDAWDLVAVEIPPAPAGGGGPITFDNHGNTTALGGETIAYDGADRQITDTTAANTVRYYRDATDRIIQRDTTISGTLTVTRYGYTATGDSPELTLDGSSNITERTIGLAGGALVTKRGTTATDVWSYPNLHGDIAATTNGNGTKTGGTYTYDPYGQTLNGLPDNSAGNSDNGWLGQHQRPTDHDAPYNIIEMGARLYTPALGRFLQTDPIPGGSANNYDYCAADPINCQDLNGTAPNWGNTTTYWSFYSPYGAIPLRIGKWTGKNTYGYVYIRNKHGFDPSIIQETLSHPTSVIRRQSGVYEFIFAYGSDSSWCPCDPFSYTIRTYEYHVIVNFNIIPGVGMVGITNAYYYTRKQTVGIWTGFF